MKKAFFFSLTTATMLWGTTALADFQDDIVEAFEAEGYTNVTATRDGDDWRVTAELDGQVYDFEVDDETGRSNYLGDDDDDEDDDSDDAADEGDDDQSDDDDEDRSDDDEGSGDNDRGGDGGGGDDNDD